MLMAGLLGFTSLCCHEDGARPTSASPDPAMAAPAACKKCGPLGKSSGKQKRSTLPTAHGNGAAELTGT